MRTEVVGTCPLCGEVYKIRHTTINRKDLIIDEVSKEGFYNGAKFTLTHSVAFLLHTVGVPYGLGKEAGKMITSVVENIGVEINLAVSEKSRFFYLIEIKCVNCNFVAKRYYTDKIE